MLRDIHQYGNAFFSVRGRSAHGGATQTLAAVRARGWVDGSGLTREGYKVIGVEPPDRPFASDPELAALIGKTADEAATALAGRNWRFLRPSFFHTADLRTGRINVHLDARDEIVTRVTVE